MPNKLINEIESLSTKKKFTLKKNVNVQTTHADVSILIDVRTSEKFVRPQGSCLNVHIVSKIDIYSALNISRSIRFSFLSLTNEEHILIMTTLTIDPSSRDHYFNEKACLICTKAP